MSSLLKEMDFNTRAAELIWLGQQMTKLAEGKQTDSILDEIFAKISFDEYLQRIEYWNSWHTKETTIDAMKIWGSILCKNEFNRIEERYPKISENRKGKNIAVIANFDTSLSPIHDFIAVLITGNNYRGFDKYGYSKLLELFTAMLIKKNPDWETKISITDQGLSNIDAVLAYQSDSKYKLMDKYLSKYPKLIRSNTNSLAILDGSESNEELELLGKDIFSFFGLCNRNVSKLFVPHNYNFITLFEALESYNQLTNHNRYANNYEYNRSVYLFGNIKHLDSGFVILKEDMNTASPTGVIHFEYYNNDINISESISQLKPNTQRVLSRTNNTAFGNFGESFIKNISDFDNNMDILEFLLNLD